MNLRFLSNVVHQGIIIKKDMVVSDSQQGLAAAATNLIDRNLATETSDVPTHTLAVVNGAQEPMPLTNTSGGQAPNADDDAARREAARTAQVQADVNTQHQVQNIATQEAQVRTAPVAPSGLQPTPADVAAAAAQVN